MNYQFEIFLVLVGFSFAVAFLILLPYWWSKHRAKMELKKEFFDAGRAMELSEEELKELWKCAGMLNKPVRAIQSKIVFEQCISKLVKENPSIADTVSRIRKKLRFDSLPWFLPLSSTKDIELYQTGFLAFGDLAYSSAVWEKSEFELHIALFDIPAKPIEAGSEVKFSFLREDDGRYYFYGEVLRTYWEGNRLVLVLPHTDKLSKIQLRSSPRWKVKIPAKVYVYADQTTHIPDAPGRALEGIVEDVGAGGVKLCLKSFVKIEVGDKIHIKFLLKSRSMEVLCSVRNIRGGTDKFCLGVKFENLNQEDEDYIRKFIAEEQRELLKVYKVGKAKLDFFSS